MKLTKLWKTISNISYPIVHFISSIQLLNYYYIFLLFVSTTLLDWNIVNVRRCAPIRESTARFGHVPADRHQAALLRVHRYLASWIFAHQLYENRKYFSYDMIREKSVEASPAKAMSYENRLNVRDESYFSSSVPFARARKIWRCIPTIVRRERRSKSVCFIYDVTWKGWGEKIPLVS